jgi:tRNA(Ile)-lysidine synthase
VPLSGAPAPVLTPDDFAELMQAAGPFPARPHIAVGLSGGPDSMTLTSLARDWVAERSGTLTALTVDHGLRPESAEEARQVAAWCAASNVAHQTLVWQGTTPRQGIQAAARDARYGLLFDWCRRNGCTELLVGHTENDQAETFLLRMSRGSGIDGLAAMPLVAHRDGMRLVRPLLTVSRARIAATVAARALAPVTDPGNTDRRYARVRLRDTVADLETQGISAHSIAGTARVFGTLRAARETKIAALAQDIAQLHAEGYAEIDRTALAAADPDIVRGLVSALIRAIGGQEYAPRRERLDRLMGFVLGGAVFRPRTLGRCVVGLRQECLVIRREYRTIEQKMPAASEKRVVWDGRFDVVFGQIPETAGKSLELRALGEAGWREVVEQAGGTGFRGIPGPVRFALPALWQGGQVVEVPHLQFRAKQFIDNIVEIAQFRAEPVLTGQPFWVA